MKGPTTKAEVAESGPHGSARTEQQFIALHLFVLVQKPDRMDPRYGYLKIESLLALTATTPDQLPEGAFSQPPAVPTTVNTGTSAMRDMLGIAEVGTSHQAQL
jgi:hypothetical protein